MDILQFLSIFCEIFANLGKHFAKILPILINFLRNICWMECFFWAWEDKLLATNQKRIKIAKSDSILKTKTKVL